MTQKNFNKRMHFVAQATNAGFATLKANEWYCGLTQKDRSTTGNPELLERFKGAMAPKPLLPSIDLTTYPEHQQFQERSRRAGGAHKHIPCILCGRPTKTNDVTIQLAGGGFDVTDPNDPDADEWSQPIGPTCLKRHPELKPYVITETSAVRK